MGKRNLRGCQLGYANYGGGTGDWAAAANGKAAGAGRGGRGAGPPRVRRAGAEPGPRQVVRASGRAGGAGGGARHGAEGRAAAGGRRRRHRLREQVPAAEVTRPPPGAERAGEDLARCAPRLRGALARGALLVPRQQRRRAGFPSPASPGPTCGRRRGGGSSQLCGGA